MLNSPCVGGWMVSLVTLVIRGTAHEDVTCRDELVEKWYASFTIQVLSCLAWGGVFGLMLYSKMKTSRDWLLALFVCSFMIYANADEMFSKFRYYHLAKAWKPQLVAEAATSMLVGFAATTFDDIRVVALIPCLLTYALRQRVTGNTFTTMLGMVTGEYRHSQATLIMIMQLMGSVFGGAMHYLLMYNTHAAAPTLSGPFVAVLVSAAVATLPGQAPYAGSLSILLQPLTLNVIVSRLTVQWAGYRSELFTATEAAPGGMVLGDAMWTSGLLLLATGLAAVYLIASKNVGLGLMSSSFAVGVVSLAAPTQGAVAAAVLYEAMPSRVAVTVADLSAGHLPCSFPIAFASTVIGGALAGLLSKARGVPAVAVIPTPDEVTFEAINSALISIAIAGRVPHKSLIVGGLIYYGCIQDGRLIPTISELVGSSVQGMLSDTHQAYTSLLFSRLMWQFLGGLIGAGVYSFLLGHIQTDAERLADKEKERLRQEKHDKERAEAEAAKKKVEEYKKGAKKDDKKKHSQADFRRPLLNLGRYKIKDSDKTKIPGLKDLQMEVGFLGGRQAYRSLQLNFTREDGKVYAVENVRLATQTLSRVLKRGNENIKQCWAMRADSHIRKNTSMLPSQQMADVRAAFLGPLSRARLTSTLVCQNDDGTIDLGFFRVNDDTIFGMLPVDEETINYSLLNLSDGDVPEQPTSFGEVLTELEDNRKRKADEDDEDVVEVPSVTPDRLRPSEKIYRGSEQGQPLLRYPTKFGDVKNYQPAPKSV
ncbi:hypothetical protein FOZ60_002159 [Perkinsus olseni]|uniref:Uncharacterized protein n=1 Tax=Perkinsus olseni TaxID=32597 RepID=A0A7J6NYP1_PEROL|nr:hypothetical protein FOZ60_002159 [Perkinsus olseni]